MRSKKKNALFSVTLQFPQGETETFLVRSTSETFAVAQAKRLARRSGIVTEVQRHGPPPSAFEAGNLPKNTV